MSIPDEPLFCINQASPFKFLADDVDANKKIRTNKEPTIYEFNDKVEETK